jgi:protein-S-isoprenylcysteine O-methyltransferase
MKANVILPIVSLLWIGSEVLLIISRRSTSPKESRDAGSIIWLNVIIYASVLLGVLTSFTSIGLIRGVRLILAWIGLVLIILGLLIRWIAIFTLRQYFTVNVAIQSGHQIIRCGIYRFIRHPSYLGSLVSFLGLGLALSNWLSIVVIMVPITLAFLSRIKLEERALMQALGEKYGEYCKSTWKLLPRLY